MFKQTNFNKTKFNTLFFNVKQKKKQTKIDYSSGFFRKQNKIKLKIGTF